MGQGGPLNTARGQIVVDVSQLATAQQGVNTFAQHVTVTLNNVGNSANKAQSTVNDLASSLTKLSAAAGLTLGIAGAAKFETDALKMATAYARQEVAARSLAGSQAQLNVLLEAYDKATGGVVDKATALANVLNLQATGFADNAQELTKFASAARGISLAKGLDPAYVLSQIQLAINNTSTMRLDQIGIDAAQVTQRVKELQAANQQMSESMAFQVAILEQADRKYGALAKSATSSATGVEQATKALENFKLSVGQFTAGPIGSFFTEAAKNIDNISQKFTDLATDINRAHDAWVNFQQDLKGGGSGGGGFVGTDGKKASRLLPDWMYADPLGDFLATHNFDARGNLISTRDTRLGPIPQSMYSRSSIGMTSGPPMAMEKTPPILDQQAIDKVKLDWGKGIADLTQKTNDDITRATNDYNENRANAERDYQTSTLRAQQDFAIQRAREEQDLNDTIARIHRDAALREQQQAEDLARGIAEATSNTEEKIADARKDANERLVKLDEDYEKARTKRAKDLSDKLLDAAGNLDAKQVYELQRNAAKQEEEAKEQHDDQRKEIQKQLDERIDDERKALAKSINQQQEAYDRQLEQSRAADALRIQDMKDDLKKRQDQEDADFGLRMDRLRQDHNDQLGEMERQQGLRIQQIKDHASAERTQLDTEHETALTKLGVHNQEWIDAETELNNKYLKLLEPILEKGRSLLLFPNASGNTQPLVTPDMMGATTPSFLGSGSTSYHNTSSFNPTVTVNIAGGSNLTQKDIDDAVHDALIRVYRETR